VETSCSCPSMCFGVRIRKRTQASDDDDDEKTKQTVSDVDVDVDAGGRTRLTNTSRGVAVPAAQGRRWDTALNNLTGLWSRDDQPASVAAFCVREALSNWKPNGPFSRRREFAAGIWCISVILFSLSVSAKWNVNWRQLEPMTTTPATFKRSYCCRSCRYEL